MNPENLDDHRLNYSHDQFCKTLVENDDAMDEFIREAVQHFAGVVVVGDDERPHYNDIELSNIQFDALRTGFRKCIDKQSNQPTLTACCPLLKKKFEDNIKGDVTLGAWDTFPECGLLFGHVMGLGKSMIGLGLIACFVKLHRLGLDGNTREHCKILLVASKGPIGVLKSEYDGKGFGSFMPVCLDECNSAAEKKEEIGDWIRDNCDGSSWVDFG